MKRCSRPCTECPTPPPQDLLEQNQLSPNLFKDMRRLHEDYYDDDISSEDEDDTLAHTSKRQKLDVECDSNCSDSVAEEENVEDADWLSLVKVKNNAQSRVVTYTKNLGKYTPDAFTCDLMRGVLKSDALRYTMLMARNHDNYNKYLQNKLGEDYKKFAFVKDLSKVPSNVATNHENGVKCKITEFQQESVLRDRSVWQKLKETPNLTKQDALQHEFYNRMKKNGVPDELIPSCYFENKKHAEANDIKLTKSPSWFDMRKQLRCSPLLLKSFLDYALKIAKESLPKDLYKVELEEFKDCVENLGVEENMSMKFLKDEKFFKTYAGVEHNDLKNKLYEWLFDLKTVKENKVDLYEQETFVHKHYEHGQGFFCLCGHVMKTEDKPIAFVCKDKQEQVEESHVLKSQKRENLLKIQFEVAELEQKFKSSVCAKERKDLESRLKFLQKDLVHVQQNCYRLPQERQNILLQQKSIPSNSHHVELNMDEFASDNDEDNVNEWEASTTACNSSGSSSAPTVPQLIPCNNNFEEEEDFDAGF